MSIYPDEILHTHVVDRKINSPASAAHYIDSSDCVVRCRLKRKKRAYNTRLRGKTNRVYLYRGVSLSRRNFNGRELGPKSQPRLAVRVNIEFQYPVNPQEL